MKEPKVKKVDELNLQIEELEERIAPIVDPFVNAILAGSLPTAGGGSQAGSHVFGNGQISAAPVPTNTPGVGPS